MMIAVDNQHYQQQFHTAQERAGEAMPNWLQTLRQQALTQLLQQGLPNTRVEDWKYTNLSALAKKTFTLPTTDPVDTTNITPYLRDGEIHLIFVNGRYHPELSSTPVPTGIEVQPLTQAITSYQEVFKPLLLSRQQQSHKLVPLNMALFTDGLLLRIKTNQQTTQPIGLYHFNQGACHMNHVRHWILAEENSQCTLMEYHYGLGDQDYLATVDTQLLCQSNSHLQHYKVQQEGTQGYHLSEIHGELYRDSSLALFNLDMGARLSRTQSQVVLKEQGGHCDVAGLYLPKKRQHMDNHTVIDHEAPQTSSDEFYKGILRDRSRAVFNGKVIVHPDAQKINAAQTNKNLLLSPHAEIDTKPQLEIFADDVQCSHGATVGQLDEEALFYLQSRGLAEQTARDVMTFGFAKDVLYRLPDDNIRLHFENLLLQQFEPQQSLRELL